MDELTRLISDLVAIDSVNPSLVPGGAGEARIAAFVADWLDEADCEVFVEEVAPGRPNVIGIAKGSGGGKTLMLNGHLDTVGVAGMADPHAPRVDGDRLHGRGAYDMKAGLAGCMLALKRAREMNLRGDVVFAAVVDEEHQSIGTRAVAAHIDRWRPDAAIVTEPTELGLVVAHKGFAWFEIETQGRAAHGSRPHLGVDAIAKMGKVLVALERLDLDLRARPTDRYLGSGSLHASLISGGQELSSYPARCALSVERRTIPGESPDLALAQIQAALDGIAASDPDFRATARITFAAEPFAVAEDAEVVRLVARCAGRIAGRAPDIGGVTFWTDAAVLAAAGVPTVLYGPAGEGAHAAVEWVDIASTRQFSDVISAAAEDFCA